MKRINTLISISLISALASCQKFVQIAPPNTQAELSNIFMADQTATSAVIGTYNSMLSGALLPFNGGITVYSGLSADEFSSLTTNSTTEPFRSNNILAANSTISTFWLAPYRNVYQVNACLEGLSASNTLSPQVKQQLTGEMLYTRALHYFYMINLFGDVPLITTTDYDINGSMPRTKISVVYDKIVSDLTEARALFANVPPLPNTRPGLASTNALLSKAYLYLGMHKEADQLATEVINSGKFSIETSVNTFLSTSKETILQFSKSNGNTSEAAAFVPASITTRPTYTLTDDLLNAFEPGDVRKSNWAKGVVVSGTTLFYPYKYKARTSTPITEFLIVQRLAEILLIRAEARAQLGNLQGAIDDIDVVRKRAGIALIKTTNPSISKENLIATILRERRVELFAEWANRWFDLKRTGNADAVLGLIKAPNWQPTDKLYPIPFSQLQVNPFLIQNEGYFN